MAFNHTVPGCRTEQTDRTGGAAAAAGVKTHMIWPLTHPSLVPCLVWPNASATYHAYLLDICLISALFAAVRFFFFWQIIPVIEEIWKECFR